MHSNSANFRRIAGAIITTAALTSLAACGREKKILGPPPGGTLTWTHVVSHLLADHSEGTQPIGCTSCHHAGTGIPDWSDYNTVVSDAPTMRLRLSVGGNMRQFIRPADRVDRRGNAPLGPAPARALTLHTRPT